MSWSPCFTWTWSPLLFQLVEEVGGAFSLLLLVLREREEGAKLRGRKGESSVKREVFSFSILFFLLG